MYCAFASVTLRTEWSRAVHSVVEVRLPVLVICNAFAFQISNSGAHEYIRISKFVKRFLFDFISDFLRYLLTASLSRRIRHSFFAPEIMSNII